MSFTRNRTSSGWSEYIGVAIMSTESSSIDSFFLRCSSEAGCKMVCSLQIQKCKFMSFIRTHQKNYVCTTKRPHRAWSESFEPMIYHCFVCSRIKCEIQASVIMASTHPKMRERSQQIQDILLGQACISNGHSVSVRSRGEF